MLAAIAIIATLLAPTSLAYSDDYDAYLPYKRSALAPPPADRDYALLRFAGGDDRADEVDAGRATRSGDRTDNFIRFGRPDGEFARYVRNRGDNHLRFGRDGGRAKRSADKKGKGSNYMRFGRNSNFLRFGRNMGPEGNYKSPIIELLSEMIEAMKKDQQKIDA